MLVTFFFFFLATGCCCCLVPSTVAWRLHRSLDDTCCVATSLAAALNYTPSKQLWSSSWVKKQDSLTFLQQFNVQSGSVCFSDNQTFVFFCLSTNAVLKNLPFVMSQQAVVSSGLGFYHISSTLSKSAWNLLILKLFFLFFLFLKRLRF